MKAGIIPRLLRVQFTPLMVAPVVLAAAASWYYWRAFDPLLFGLALAGSVCLHLAANAIDDVYDYVNGTDKIADEVLPRDFPGWKPMARGMVSVRGAFAVSWLFYGVALGIGVGLSYIVGAFALVIAIPGILLSYFYTAPPLKLDYRGLGLGELAILLSFGPIPVTGVFFVITQRVSLEAFALGLPSGLLTTGILISHDLIFYDVYKLADKRSAAVVLGRKAAAALSTWISILAYLIVVGFVLLGVAPLPTLLVLLALPLLVKAADFGRAEKPLPEYGKRTTIVFVHSVLFTVLLAAGFVIG